jgi:hypothetical protein
MLAALIAGCQSGPSSQKVTVTEPPLAVAPDGSGTTIVDKSAPREITFVDRHPLFSKPREYYENSGDNKFVKVTAATVVGVPVGFFNEIKQIVVGAPAEPRY